MLNLAWGGFANGSAALAAVCVQAEGGIPGDLLEVNTARAWSGWRNAVHARTGAWLSLDHSDLIAPGLRDVPNQQLAWDRYQRQGSPVASHPPDRTHQGSNHGWGRALDVTGFENRADVWQAMNDLAPQFGLSNATGRASGERWHWESTNAPTTVASSGAATIINNRTDDEMEKWEAFKKVPAPGQVRDTSIYISRNRAGYWGISGQSWDDYKAFWDANGIKLGSNATHEENVQSVLNPAAFGPNLTSLR